MGFSALEVAPSAGTFAEENTPPSIPARALYSDARIAPTEDTGGAGPRRGFPRAGLRREGLPRRPLEAAGLVDVGAGKVDVEQGRLSCRNPDCPPKPGLAVVLI